jgi:Cache domain
MRCLRVAFVFAAVLGFVAAAWPLTATAQSDNAVQTLRGRILEMQAEGIADKISQLMKEIQTQVAWTTQLPWTTGISMEQRRFDALRLLRLTPAVVELLEIDAQGREQLKVSRLALDVVGSGIDQSSEPKFTESVAKRVYYGPVYSRRNSEPCITLGLAGTRSDTGVSVVELRLEWMRDVVRQTKVGDRGVAYVVDAEGRVIAHQDFDLSLRDFSGLAHVQAARAVGLANSKGVARITRDINGLEVLATYARVAGPNWLVLVELPTHEIGGPP